MAIEEGDLVVLGSVSGLVQQVFHGVHALVREAVGSLQLNALAQEEVKAVFIGRCSAHQGIGLRLVQLPLDQLVQLNQGVLLLLLGFSRRAGLLVQAQRLLQGHYLVKNARQVRLRC